MTALFIACMTGPAHCAPDLLSCLNSHALSLSATITSIRSYKYFNSEQCFQSTIHSYIPVIYSSTLLIANMPAIYTSGSQPGRNFISSGQEFLLFVKLPFQFCTVSVVLLFQVDIGPFNELYHFIFSGLSHVFVDKL